MPLLKFALSFIVGISISIQALADIKSPDDSLSSDQVIERANTLQDVDTTLVDGIPVVNAPCQFHKEASVPFPDDYKFKNPVFHEKMKFINDCVNDVYPYFDKTKTGLPQNIFPNCRLVEDRGDNVTYKCDDNYYRFQYLGERYHTYRPDDKGCLLHVYASVNNTFEGISHDLLTYEIELDTKKCPPPATKYDNEIEQCLTLDDVRPTLPDPIPECPVHPFTTTPLPKNTQFKNPIFNKKIESIEKYPKIFLTLTPTSIEYNNFDDDYGEYFNCDLIENNMTNITYYCKQMPNEDPGIDGFIRIRSVGYEVEEISHKYFRYGRCRLLVNTLSNTKNNLKQTYSFLDTYTPPVYTVKTTSCGPTERHPIFRHPHPMVFPGDVCVPTK